MNDIDPPEWPGWRSLLFVPATNQKLLAKAAGRGADALILDLEDAVAGADKAAARVTIPGAVGRLHSQSTDVLVRVNAGTLDLVRDLIACVTPGLRAIVLPKAERADRIGFVDALLGDLESEAGLAPGSTGVIPLVETARGLLAAPELAAASPRVLALALGSEDLALDLGSEPAADVLTEPARRVVWSARAAGRAAVGFPGSIANFSDGARLAAELASARRVGFSAALCIHPAQLEHCHQAFAVTPEEAEQARRVVDAFAGAQRSGTAVCVLDGRMIDRPVAQRARATLARWRKQAPEQ